VIEAAPARNNMRNIFIPENEVDLALIQGLLDEAGIRYFVHNDHFGSLHIGPVIPLFNEKAVMVAPADEERARALIEPFLAETTEDTDAAGGDYSWKDLLRMAFEIAVFGWIMPGKRWRRRRPKQDRTD